MATEFSIETLLVADVREQLVVPAGRVEHQLGVDRDLAVGAVAAVELDDVELAVLAALEEVVVEDRGPSRPSRRSTASATRRRRDSFHSSTGWSPVDGDDAVVVVARAGVDEREAVGVDGDRALDDVAGGEVGEDPLAGVGVEEVDLAVVGAEHHPGAAVALEHRRLAGPAGAAPRPWSRPPSTDSAHMPPVGREAPQHAGVGGHGPGAVGAAGGVAPEGQEPGLGGVGGGSWWAAPRARSCSAAPSPRWPEAWRRRWWASPLPAALPAVVVPTGGRGQQQGHSGGTTATATHEQDGGARPGVSPMVAAPAAAPTDMGDRCAPEVTPPSRSLAACPHRPPRSSPAPGGRLPRRPQDQGPPPGRGRPGPGWRCGGAPLVGGTAAPPARSS